MSMFCYQCQEAAKGTGCTIKGVCGKNDDVANLQDLLIFVLKGISIYSTQARKKGIENDSLVQILKPNIDVSQKIIIDGAFGLPDTAKIEIK